MIEQSKGKIAEYNKAIIEHSEELIKISPGMSSKEFNVRLLYAYLYGHTPKRNYGIRVTNKEEKIIFIDGSSKCKDGDQKTTNLGQKNFSFFDTAYKLGIECFPISKNALYLTDIGLIAMETWGRKIADTTVLSIGDVDIFADTDEDALKLADTFMENIVEVDYDSPTTTKYLWVKTGYSGGLATEELEFDKFDLKIKENYNDDMPYDDIVNLINSDNHELILLDGKPGTGKTSLIKHLMAVAKNKFLYIDSSLLIGLDPSKFIEFLLYYRNSVVVLEDCEKILSEREGGNPFMGALLNLTDGIIGETVKAKFICSFNCKEDKIDQALLRKGRMSLKYTFNELSLEKTKALMPEATKPMVLAEIYHKDKKNVVGERPKRKIGF